VFEELGAGFTLLAFGADERTIAAFEHAAGKLEVPLKTVRDTFADGRSAYAAKLILVRPDRYVAWLGDGAPADVGTIMRKVAGRA
jgi:hypothetical protein